jgi:hypothetical protein
MKSFERCTLHQFLVAVFCYPVRRKLDFVKTSLDHETDILWRQKLTIGRKANEGSLVALPEPHQEPVALV